MQNAGLAHMGVGTAQGKDKAEVAAKSAISSPLLETSITGCKGIIINFTSSPDIGLDEVEYAASLVGQEAHPDANVIWGVAFDPELEDEMRVTVIATGFDAGDNKSSSKVISKPVLDGEPAKKEEAAAETVTKEQPDDEIDIPQVFGKRSNRFNIGF